MRGFCMVAFLAMAGCLGGGGSPQEGPEEFDEEDDPIEVIADIITTGITVTTITATGGS